MCKHLVHVIGLTVLIFISTPAYLQHIKVKAELAWRPCQQEFNLIEFSEYAKLDKSLNFAHEPVAEIDFFQGSMIKKKKKNVVNQRRSNQNVQVLANSISILSLLDLSSTS